MGVKVRGTDKERVWDRTWDRDEHGSRFWGLAMVAWDTQDGVEVILRSFLTGRRPREDYSLLLCDMHEGIVSCMWTAGGITLSF